MTSARITVTRQSPADIGRRPILLKLDGGDFAILKHGGEATRAVEPGRHRLMANNTLF